MHRVRVELCLFFTGFDCQLRYQSGFFGGDGPVVNLKLTGNNQRRVSRHCERLITAEDAGVLITAWRHGKEELAAAAERIRLEEEQKRKEQQRLEAEKAAQEKARLRAEKEAVEIQKRNEMEENEMRRHLEGARDHG